MRLTRRRRTSPASDRQEQLRRARVGAPTLRDASPTAAQVAVELVFDADTSLAPAPQQLTVFPPAQAHFVYACPFGDCNGTFDLNGRIFDMLRSRTAQTSGVLHCEGHRSSGAEAESQCGLGVAFSATVSYVEEDVPDLQLSP